MAKHSTMILDLARRGAHARIKELEAEIAQLRAVLNPRKPNIVRVSAVPGGGTVTAHISSPPRNKRTMSAAARKRISDAQKARWAAQRKEKKS